MSTFPMSVYASDSERYDAVRDRARAADGQFFYAVVTTGVFCKPSCGSRLPLRENVRFFTSAAAAERAGFRACKRCKPKSARDGTSELVTRVCAILDSTDEPVTLERLAAEVGMSPYHLHRVFRAATGVTPRAYAEARRRRRTHEALREGGTVTRAIYDAGFESSSRFYARADSGLGMAPKAFKQGGSGVEVRYAVAPCSLGFVLVAAGDRGICAIDLGEDRRTLAEQLGNRFANAVSVEEDDALAGWVTAVVAHIDEGAALDVPLEIRGTLFQQRVWAVLRNIPRGKTMSYAAIAEKLGSPKAVRAVGSACGRNALAVVIPCHRAVGKDGGMHGYRWGVAIKKKLLEREKRSRK